MVVVIGAFLLPILGLFAVIMMILAAVKANRGELYRYPMTFRLVK